MSPAQTSHSDDFPPNKHSEKDKLSHAPKIPAKDVILPIGEKMPISDTEATLNWQYENAIYHNRILFSINQTLKNDAQTRVS